MGEDTKRPKYAVEIYLVADQSRLMSIQSPVVYLVRSENEQLAADDALHSWNHSVDHINVYPVGERVEFRPAAQRVDPIKETE